MTSDDTSQHSKQLTEQPSAPAAPAVSEAITLHPAGCPSLERAVAKAKQESMADVITYMGMAFILGSLVTTFLLLLLDFLRRNQPEE